MGDRCRVPRAFWSAIKRHGLAPAEVLRRARLPASLHLNSDGFVSTKHYFALWKALEAMSDDPALGTRLMQAADTATLPPPSLAPFYARDYRDGLQRVSRFKRLCTPEQLHFTESEGEFAIRPEWLHATEPEPAVATDVAFTYMVELGRRGTGQRILPIRVELMRPDPKSDGHQAYFGCPIHFGARRNVLVLKSSDLDRPFPGYNPELLALLTPALTSALAAVEARRSIRTQVKGALKRALASGRPDISQVAEDIGITERTLQRRITEEGTSFRALLTETRQELGRQFLSDPSVGIEEVAYLLGFKDSKSFYRAFRDWEGLTPSRWRALHVPGAAADQVEESNPLTGPSARFRAHRSI